MKEISTTANFNGLPGLKITKYIDFLESTGMAKVEILNFKRDLRGWNDSPHSLRPLKTVLIKTRDRRGEFKNESVYQIWENSFGLMRAFYFEDLQEYENYNPSDEMPDAIKREIGLCENYHKGI